MFVALVVAPAWVITLANLATPYLSELAVKSDAEGRTNPLKAAVAVVIVVTLAALQVAADPAGFEIEALLEQVKETGGAAVFSYILIFKNTTKKTGNLLPGFGLGRTAPKATAPPQVYVMPKDTPTTPTASGAFASRAELPLDMGDWESALADVLDPIE